jgi:RNA polymerase sigma factor (TIGR02999 family)
MSVTQLLNQINDGKPQAAEQLLPLVYKELRDLAARWITEEKPGQTLQATALVHEAFLRLVDRECAQRWDSRGHFFAAAAEAMRRILVEQARRKSRLKRGAGYRRTSIEAVEIAAPEMADDLLALDEALVRLADEHPQKAELVKLRYFAGLTVAEAAQALGISKTTAERYWTYARAWLFRDLGRQRQGDADKQP